MFFWNSLALSMIQWMLANWSLVPLPFLNPTGTSENSWFTYCWSLAWKILSLTLLVCEMCAIVHTLHNFLNILWHCLSLGLEGKLTFPVLWPLLSFPNLLAYWVQHFHNTYQNVKCTFSMIQKCMLLVIHPTEIQYQYIKSICIIIRAAFW